MPPGFDQPHRSGPRSSKCISAVPSARLSREVSAVILQTSAGDDVRSKCQRYVIFGPSPQRAGHGCNAVSSASVIGGGLLESWARSDPMADTHYRSCNLCEATCGVAIDVEGDRVVGIRGDEADPFSRGYICPKATALADLHHDPDRLRRPLVRERAGWRE